MERSRDRYRHATEIENDARRTQDPGRQTLTSSPAANGQTSFPASSTREQPDGATPRAEDSFAIHLLGFASTGDQELDALYQEAEAYLASRDGEQAGGERDTDGQGQEDAQDARGGDEEGGEQRAEGEQDEPADDLADAADADIAEAVEATDAANADISAAAAGKRERGASKIIPDLPGPKVDAANDHLEAGRKQNAIDVLLTAAKQRGRVDVRLLHRRRMRYDPKLTGLDGAAYFPKRKNGEVSPTKVSIGDSALDQGVAWLYTTMLHEYQHVLQFQGKRGIGTRAPGLRGKGLGKQQETEAYARELILSRKTGLALRPDLMTVVWGQMQAYWQNLPAKGRKPLRKMMDHARHIYRRVVRKARIGSASEEG